MEQFDVYCERTDFAFWSEPINAVTNLAFIVAAAYAFMIRPRNERADWPVLILITIIALVGTGSFLFHTLATRWASLADVLPILAFIYFFFFMAMRRLFGLGLVQALVATALFFLAARYSAPLFRPLIGYSAGYLPPLLGLYACGLLLAFLKKPGAMHLLAAGIVFSASLTFRVLDDPLCGSFPLGTHFLWHLLNAIVLFILVRSLMNAANQDDKLESS